MVFLHSDGTLTKIMLLKNLWSVLDLHTVPNWPLKICHDEAWKLQEIAGEPASSQCSPRHLPPLDDRETLTPWTSQYWVLLLVLPAFAGGGCRGRSKDFIPGKCFLQFQDHGLAHVQPQTQCTIAGAAREEKAEGEKKKKRREKYFEFRCKSQQASQKQAQEGVLGMGTGI